MVNVTIINILVKILYSLDTTPMQCTQNLIDIDLFGHYYTFVESDSNLFCSFMYTNHDQ